MCDQAVSVTWVASWLAYAWWVAPVVIAPVLFAGWMLWLVVQALAVAAWRFVRGRSHA